MRDASIRQTIDLMEIKFDPKRSFTVAMTILEQMYDLSHRGLQEGKMEVVLDGEEVDPSEVDVSQFVMSETVSAMLDAFDLARAGKIGSEGVNHETIIERTKCVIVNLVLALAEALVYFDEEGGPRTMAEAFSELKLDTFAADWDEAEAKAVAEGKPSSTERAWACVRAMRMQRGGNAPDEATVAEQLAGVDFEAEIAKLLNTDTNTENKENN